MQSQGCFRHNIVEVDLCAFLTWACSEGTGSSVAERLAASQGLNSMELVSSCSGSEQSLKWILS
jgi:hypothetical protein